MVGNRLIATPIPAIQSNAGWRLIQSINHQLNIVTRAPHTCPACAFSTPRAVHLCMYRIMRCMRLRWRPLFTFLRGQLNQPTHQLDRIALPNAMDDVDKCMPTPSYITHSHTHIIDHRYLRIPMALVKSDPSFIHKGHPRRQHIHPIHLWDWLRVRPRARVKTR